MTQVHLPQLTLEVEDQGQGPPLLLMMGLGAQLVFWPDGFCDALAARGLRVIRFDARDVGRSTHFGERGNPNVVAAGLRWILGLPVPAPYTLHDLAGDTGALLDALGLPDAHVLGMSMGGMVAQLLGVSRPDRVRSLVLHATSPVGQRFLGRPLNLLALIAPPARTPEAALDRGVEMLRMIGSPGFDVEPDVLRRLVLRARERDADPTGYRRQLAATLATRFDLADLGKITAPTLVLHGLDDPLLPVGLAIRTARAIPGARLQLVPGLGHDLPRGAWPILADAIADHVHAAERRRTAAA
jgi:pimeloyl-ACP methyl ester carboxylesterase